MRAGARRRRAQRHAPGLRGPALVEAILPLRRQALARRRSRPSRARPPDTRRRATPTGRHLFNARHHLSMPDKWEYPWYAAWDLAFHMIPMCRIDPYFAKDQLLLLLREWYLRPDGALPAYEWNFSDVNPPVHAWACWRVYKITGRPRAARHVLPRALLPETAAEFHLVGESQGRHGTASLRRRLPRHG